MDSISSFDGYTTYSDSSAPRTPSPRTDDRCFSDHPKHIPDEPLVRNIFAEHHDEPHGVAPEFYPSYSSGRGSLLQELYEHDPPQTHDPPPQTHDLYLDSDSQPQQQQQQWHRPHDYTMMRRATFPYVRHDRDDGMSIQQYPPFIQHQHPPYPSSAYHHNHHHHHHLDSSYYDDPAVKLEESPSPLMVPTQGTPYYHRPGSSGGLPSPPHHYAIPMGSPGLLPAYISPHTGLPVQHTDDAASKETQYLRRRCFNCHTTEPPSWRRSTLNPGKIVCNKCGLYERTHLRPRPLRFDELRAGNKARKSKGAPTHQPPSLPSQPASPKIKKEPREYSAGASPTPASPALHRRSSISSNSSSHSGGAASDWDDTVSLYSSSAGGSAPPSSFNSPAVSTFSLQDSPSPPSTTGIRLPSNPLSDIASINSPPLMRKKSHSMPYPSPTAWHDADYAVPMEMEMAPELTA